MKREITIAMLSSLLCPCSSNTKEGQRIIYLAVGRKIFYFPLTKFFTSYSCVCKVGISVSRLLTHSLRQSSLHDSQCAVLNIPRPYLWPYTIIILDL